MIYRMLVLFTCCWGSNLSIQTKVGKLNGDLLQPFRIRYEVWSFSVRHLISIAYWKWLIFGVKLFVVVPQAIGISPVTITHPFTYFVTMSFMWGQYTSLCKWAKVLPTPKCPDTRDSMSFSYYMDSFTDRNT